MYDGDFFFFSTLIFKCLEISPLKYWYKFMMKSPNHYFPFLDSALQKMIASLLTFAICASWTFFTQCVIHNKYKNCNAEASVHSTICVTCQRCSISDDEKNEDNSKRLLAPDKQTCMSWRLNWQMQLASAVPEVFQLVCGWDLPAKLDRSSWNNFLFVEGKLKGVCHHYGSPTGSPQ